jgi:AraC-like DNA-binding protein
MPTPRIEVAPELIAEGKQLYETTDLPVHDIAARMGLTRHTLNNRIREWHWTRRRYNGAAAPAPPAPSPVPAASPSETAAAGLPVPVAADAAPLPFAERMVRVLDAELAVIERTLKVLGPASNAEAERTARVLAMISRTVQEIQASAEGQTRNETDDDPVPGDIDEFRLALARRIRGFIETRRAGVAGVSGERETPLD